MPEPQPLAPPTPPADTTPPDAEPPPVGQATTPEVAPVTVLPAFAGRYRLEAEIGRGGMGVIVRATDPEFQRPLAIKLLLAPVQERPDLERRFRAEAQLTSQLQHPGIAPVHDQGWLADGRPFFCM